jgi:hypothetical protein
LRSRLKKEFAGPCAMFDPIFPGTYTRDGAVRADALVRIRWDLSFARSGEADRMKAGGAVSSAG